MVECERSVLFPLPPEAIRTLRRVKVFQIASKTRQSLASALAAVLCSGLDPLELPRHGLLVSACFYYRTRVSSSIVLQQALQDMPGLEVMFPNEAVEAGWKRSDHSF